MITSNRLYSNRIGGSVIATAITAVLISFCLQIPDPVVSIVLITVISAVYLGQLILHFTLVEAQVYTDRLEIANKKINPSQTIHWQDVKSISKYWFCLIPAYMITFHDSRKPVIFYSDWGIKKSRSGRIYFNFKNRMGKALKEVKASYSIF